MLHPILRYPIVQDISQREIPNNNDSGSWKIRIMRMKAKSQSQSSLFQNQTDRSTNGINNNKDLIIKRHQSFHEPSCGTNTIQNQSLLGSQKRHVVIQQSIQDIIRKKGAHSFSTSSNQLPQYPTKQLNYQPIASAKSNNNNNTISTSTGQMLALNQSQSIAQLLPNHQQQQISLNRSHCSISFASNRGTTSYSMGVTASTTAKRSFYHHSNIFNLKQYKNITGYGITDEGDEDIDAIKEDQQRSLLIRQFRHKVRQYLLMAQYRKDQAIREFNGYYKTIEGQGLNSSSRKRKNMQEGNIAEDGVKVANRTRVSQKNRRDSNGDAAAGGISFLSSRGMMINNAGQLLPDDINQSLSMIQQNSQDLNRYLVNLNSSRFNYSKLSKQEASMMMIDNVNNIDIYLEDSVGNRSTLNAAKRFDHSKLQDMVLDRITKVIPSDIEYDQKIQRYTEEYERILQKLTNKSFRIKVPEHYEPQMQQFNEFYVIGEKKTKDQRKREEEEIPWNQINDLVITQVLQDERQREEDAKENEEQQQVEVDQRQKVGGVGQVVIERAESQIVKQIDTIGDKKKEEKKSTGNNNIGIKQEDVQSGRNVGGQANEQGGYSQRDNETLQRETVGVEGSEKKPRKVKERSAMEEYTMFRPASPSFATPKKPKKKQEIISAIVAQPKTDSKSAAKKIEIPIIQIPDATTQQKDNAFNVTTEKQYSNRDSNRSKNTNKSQTDRGEVKETRVAGIDDEEISSKQQISVTILKKEETKQQVTVKEKNRDIDMKPDQKQEGPEIGKSSVKIGDVDSAGTKVLQGISEIKPSSLKINDSGSSGQDPSSSNESQQPNYSQRLNIPKNDKEQDEDEEEIASTSGVRHNPGLIPGTPKQNGYASRNTGNTPKYQSNSTTLRENDNPMDLQHSENTYFNEMSPKKRIGTGLIDELVKINYLLDFNLNEYKKDRKAPELPQELEFKRAEERLLFDQIFQWQYEVDLDIQEIEEKLNIPMRNRKHHDSEDDNDDEDDDHGHNSKASVHSSEITDFGPAPPLRNDSQDDNDFDDEEFSDQDE